MLFGVVLKCRNALELIPKNNTVGLVWIKEHEENHGNEEMDMLMRAESRIKVPSMGLKTYSPMSLDSVNNTIRADGQARVKETWVNMKTCRYTMRLLKLPPMIWHDSVPSSLEII